MIPLPIHFAPLQGHTEAPYRQAHHTSFGGIEAYYTPFVRIEKGVWRNKDLRDIAPEHNRVGRVIPQLIAATPEEMEKLARLFASLGYREADINLGCPFPPVAHRKKGAGILPHPEAVAALLEVTRNIPRMRFSVKMRPGWDHPSQGEALIPLLNAAPLTHITLHSRLGIQQYKGNSDAGLFDLFYQQIRLPLIYNGDLRTVADIEKVAERFPGLAGVMIGRGLLANPALALEYRQSKALSATERQERMQALHTDLLHTYSQQIEGGEAQLLSKMKAFWEYTDRGDKKALKAIRKSRRMADYLHAVSVWMHSL
ncbi:MAG: tRNA-dihydrouridine synthase family protein [Bacteroides sp.]|nr:tRNA-dihydrouridine synthase family protein [Bacteroides sp.]